MKYPVLLVLVLISFAQPAWAALFSVAGGVSTAVAIDKASDAIGSRIQQAEQSGDFLLGQALKNVLTALDAFRVTSEGLLDKSFAEVRALNREFFDKIENTYDRLLQDAERMMERGESMLNLTYQLTSDTIFAKDRIAVTRFQPSAFYYSKEGQVRIRVDGVNIGSPTLIIGDQRFEPAVAVLTHAEFLIPRNLVAESSKPTTLNAVVEMRKSRWWHWKDIEVRQPVQFTVIPPVLGKFSFREMVPTQKKEQRVKQALNIAKSGRNYLSKHAILASDFPEWYIIPDVKGKVLKGGLVKEKLLNATPPFVVLHKVSGASSGDPYIEGTVTRQGFTVAMAIDNSRDIWNEYDGHGTYHVYWKEERVVHGVGPLEPIAGDLPAEGFVQHPTHSELLAIEGTFVDFNGKEWPFSLEKGTPLLDVRREATRLIISPARLEF